MNTPNISITDNHHWETFRAGEPASLSALYERHYQKLFRYGIRIMADRVLVEDCIQDVFLALWKNRAGLGQVNHVPSYLFKCLRRKILQFVKHRHSRLTNEGEDYPFLVEYSAEEILIAGQIEQSIKEKLARALNQLTARQKEAIYLKFYNQLGYEEIGAIMNIHYQSIRTLIYQAVKSLKQQITLDSLLWLWVLENAVSQII